LGVMNTEAKATLVAVQRWKLWLWGIALGTVGIGLFAPSAVAGMLGVSTPAVLLCATACGVVVLVGASQSITCPACGLSLVWHGLSKQSHTVWLSWLFHVEVCPRCGHSNASSRSQQ
jgi:predicted RNA-binding Zn-ribbon protein involved in translation (DUF1610 family)